MRNDIFIKAYARKICDFHYNEEAKKGFSTTGILEDIYIITSVSKWHKELEELMPQIRESYKSNPHISRILDMFEETYFYKGSLEYFSNLLPRRDIVLSHNDGQENNILSSLYDPQKIMLIDFEYIGMNPRAFDLANYCNETVIDNAYPLRNGIAYYLENFIKDEEQTLLLTEYLKNYYEKFYRGDKSKESENEYIKKEIEILRKEVH